MLDEETRKRLQDKNEQIRNDNKKRLNALVLTYRAKAAKHMLPNDMHEELRAITEPLPLTDIQIQAVVFYAYKQSLTLAKTAY